MSKRLWICICLMMIFPVLFSVTSCGKKTVLNEQMAEETNPVLEEKMIKQKQVVGVKKQAKKDINSAQQAAKEGKKQDSNTDVQIFVNENIYFDFDSSLLNDSARETLIRKAEWLRTNLHVSVTIEGHCDERGTSAYNIALGDRRAQSALVFLADLDIETKRFSTVSYGEERPVESDQTEEAWAKNRRAHFVID